jgi:hypothetical protein
LRAGEPVVLRGALVGFRAWRQRASEPYRRYSYPSSPAMHRCQAVPPS